MTFTGTKFYPLLAGNTLNAHEKVITLLKDRISGLQEVETVEQSDFILAFCSVVSRAGTDINAAVKKLQDAAGIDVRKERIICSRKRISDMLV